MGSEKQNALSPIKAQLLGVLASYAVARLYLVVISCELPEALQPWGYPLFTVLFLAWGESVFTWRERSEGQAVPRAVRYEAAFWAVCTFALAMALAVAQACQWPEIAGGIWATLFWHGFAAYWVVCRSGCLTEQTTGAFFAWDALRAIFVLPFSGFFLRLCTLFRAVKSLLLGARKQTVDGRKLGITLFCVAAAIPVFCCAADLLTKADSGFARLLEGFRLNFSDSFTSAFWAQASRFFFSLPVGAYLYGLFARCTEKRSQPDTAVAVRAELEHIRVVPKAAEVAILAAFCLLYLLFFFVQAGYLFGAFAGRLPDGFTVAEYARQGFYQLCWILVLNFGLLTVCAKMSCRPVRRAKAVRLFCVLLMAASLLFATTAFSKLALYVKCFGFTQRRLLSTWAVIVFAAGSIYAIVTMLRARPVVGRFVRFAAATYVILCFWPVQGYPL